MRRILYAIARLLGDLASLRVGRPGRRLTRRSLGRFLGRFLR